MIFKTITLLLFATAFMSCKPNHDYDVNYDGDKLVVNAMMEGSMGITVALSKSQSPAGIIPDVGFNVKNGRVWLYQNDTLVAEMTLNTLGKYTINGFKPQVGKSYHLKAVAKDLDTVESLPVFLPALPAISSYTFKKDNSYARNPDNGAALLSLNFQDNGSEKKFYLVDSYVQINSDSIQMYLTNGLVSSLQSCEFYYYSIGTLFTDKCFDGTGFKLDYFSEHKNKGTLKITFSIVDKNIFTYLRNQDQPKGLELGFVEPQLNVSNMKNGYGLFAAKNTRTFSWKLD